MRTAFSGRTRARALRRAAICGVAAAGSLGIGVAAASRGGGDERHARGAAVAKLHDASGNAVGTVRFSARPGGVLRVKVDVSGLTPGFHGIHVHAAAQCVAPFTTAGGHHNPGAQGHSAHAGDLPPLFALQDGTATARFDTDAVTLAGLLDAAGDGSSLIVHAGRDNLANIPAQYHSHVPDASSTTFGPNATTLATGDSGARVACGVVARRGHGR